MEWTKEAPKEPGYYWILDNDEDGTAWTSIVEVIQMPDNTDELKDLLELESPDEAEKLAGKLLVLYVGDSNALLLDEAELAEVSWYGPIEEPEIP